MISVETSVTGYDARSWHRLLTLVAPGLASRAPWEAHLREEEAGGLLALFYQGDRVLRALHTHRGIELLGAWPGPDGLSALAAQTRSQFALAFERGALEELFERLGARVSADDDALTTWLLLLTALRELGDEGRAHLYPKLLPASVPLPSPEMVRRAFDLLLPRDRALLVALFDGDRLDTCLLAHRAGESIDRIEGPEVLQSLLGSEVRLEDHRALRQAVERHRGPLALGLFAQTESFHRLLRSERSGAWAEALALRDVVLDPLPGWLGVAAGAGAVRATLEGARGLLSGLRMWNSLQPALGLARGAVERLTGGVSPAQALGFDPLGVLARVLTRSGPSGSAPHDSSDA